MQKFNPNFLQGRYKWALSYLQSKLIHFIENLQVERKLRLCQEFLDVFGRVDPGQATDWWAVTQLEAIGAKSVLLQRDLESGKIPASAFKEALIGRVTLVVKFRPFEFKILFTGSPISNIYLLEFDPWKFWATHNLSLWLYEYFWIVLFYGHLQRVKRRGEF